MKLIIPVVNYLHYDKLRQLKYFTTHRLKISGTIFYIGKKTNYNANFLNVLSSKNEAMNGYK